MANVLVTGGAGFIGANLVNRLVIEGHNVRVIDNLSTGIAARLARNDSSGMVEFIEADVRDSSAMAKAAIGIDKIYHLAATVGVPLVLADPAECIANNIDGTRSVLAAAKRAGARLVFASSSEVYGFGEDRPLAEDDHRRFGAIATPRWAYGESKAIGEYLCQVAMTQGQPISIVRYFNAYGPGLNKSGLHSVVGALIRDCMSRVPMRIYGDGTQRRCFTYIDDIVAGTIAAMEIDAALGQTLNIGSTVPTSINALSALIGAHCNQDAVPEKRLLPFQAVYGEHFEEASSRSPNMDRTKCIIGFEAQTELSEGIAKTVAWWRSETDSVANEGEGWTTRCH